MQLGRDAMGGDDPFARDGPAIAAPCSACRSTTPATRPARACCSVSPGGPAAEAGLRDSDVIVSLDGKSIAGDSNAGRALVEQMRSVKPEQKVKVRVLRDGKNKDFVVVARPMAFRPAACSHMRSPEMGGAHRWAASATWAPCRWSSSSARFFPGEFGGMELASLTPKLGAYFGTNEGVLVVQAPENDAFKLEDGDVIQSIDGRKPDDGAHAMRILRSYSSGEKVNLNVLRQRKPVTLAVTMPERPEFDGDHFAFECADAADAADAARCRRCRVCQAAPARSNNETTDGAAMAVNSPPCAAPTSPTNSPKNS